jgi:CheY-like chemotaxis protein
MTPKRPGGVPADGYQPSAPDQPAFVKDRLYFMVVPLRTALNDHPCQYNLPVKRLPLSLDRKSNLDNFILVAEGDPHDRALILRAISDADVTADAITVGDGKEALDYLFARGDYAGRDDGVQPRLVLLDLALPGMGSLEVLRRLRQDERTGLLRIVAICSSDQAQDVDAAYRAGANSYVYKPTDSARFVEAMQLAVRYWLTISLPPPEGGMGRRGRGETFRGLWFRPPLMRRRKFRRTAVLFKVLALFLAYPFRMRN